MVMDRHDIRYLFEHKVLPTWFYEHKVTFVGELLRMEGLLYGVINDMFNKEIVENPYNKSQFTMDAAKLLDNLFVIRIGFPRPEEAPLCYCSYLFFDDEFERASYYCIEKADREDGGSAFVCSWTIDGDHINYGRCLLEDHKDFLRCVELYLANNPESEQ